MTSLVFTVTLISHILTSLHRPRLFPLTWGFPCQTVSCGTPNRGPPRLDSVCGGVLDQELLNLYELYCGAHPHEHIYTNSHTQIRHFILVYLAICRFTVIRESNEMRVFSVCHRANAEYFLPEQHHPTVERLRYYTVTLASLSYILFHFTQLITVIHAII